MRSIQRVYFYLIAFISIETVIGGLVYLAQTLFKSGIVVNLSNQLAQGLSLTLVGLPIFLIHWVKVQKDAAADEEERACRIRAWFFYAIRLSTLVFISLNLLAMINRFLLQAVQSSSNRAFIGGDQSLTDNLIIIAVNGLVFGYFEWHLRQAWKEGNPSSPFQETRRLFNYIWMLYTFWLGIFGVQQVLYVLISNLYLVSIANEAVMANAIATTLVGVPLWAWIWVSIQKGLGSEDESRSGIRQTALYLLVLGSAVTSIGAAYVFIKELSAWLVNQPANFTRFLADNNQTVSLLIVAAVTWIYFNHPYHHQLNLEKDAGRRAGSARFHQYILAAIGFGFLFSGLLWLGRVSIDIGMNAIGDNALKEAICGSISSILVGLVVWLKYWRQVQNEAYQDGEIGNQARRSVVRKSALYLAIFAGTAGVMGAAGSLLYLVFQQALGGQEDHYLLECFYRTEILVIVAVWLIYYIVVLIRDGKFSRTAANRMYAAFPVLLMGLGDRLTGELDRLLARQTPGLPLTRQAAGEMPALETLQTIRAVVLPSGLLTGMDEGQRQMLNGVNAQRIVLPQTEAGWVWLDNQKRNEQDLAQEIARVIRQMAEGQEVRPRSESWNTVLKILGWIFIVQVVLFTIFMILIRTFD